MCSSLNDYYNKVGHNSNLIVGKKKTNNPKVYQIPNEKNINFLIKAAGYVSKNFSPFTKHMIRYVFLPNYRSKVNGREPMYYPGIKAAFSSFIDSPDIVQLNNLHGKYFDLRKLPWISKNIPTVLRLSDMWSFTGHCAYSKSCNRWHNGCGDCPDLNLYPSIELDKTRENIALKESIYKKSKLYISSPSNWLLEKAKLSILRHAAIDYKKIPTGIDLDQFFPKNKKKLRYKHKIQNEDIVIIIYASGNKSYKWDYFSDLLGIFQKERILQSKIVLLIIGKKGNMIKKGNLIINYIGYIDDKIIYRNYLRIADLFLHLSTADTYPNAIMEALSCGVPTIAFEAGGIPEQIIPYNKKSKYFSISKLSTGALAAKGDLLEVITILKDLIYNESIRKNLSINATQYAKTNFDFKNFANEYLKWYEEILSN